MTPKISGVRPREYDAIQRFLESVYGHSHDYFGRAYPSVWRRDNTRFEDILVLREAGRIVSLVRIFPLSLRLGAVRVAAGGIGGVATEYEGRGKGRMSLVLDAAIAEMRRRQYQVSVLWGDRHRYNNFGYEVCGRTLEVTINTRGLGKCGVEPVAARRWLGERAAARAIEGVYRRNPFRVDRPGGATALILQKAGISAYHAGAGRAFSYVCTAGEYCGSDVLEQGGDPRTVLSILAYLAKRFGTGSFTLRYPDAAAVPPAVLAAASYWRVTPSCMLKILDLKETLRAYLPALRPALRAGPATVGIEGAARAVSVDGTGVADAPAGTGLVLPEIEMVRLLFGTMPAVPNDNRGGADRLGPVLPLPLFLQTLDHV